MYDHEGMASILSSRFFADWREDIPLSFPDDPPPWASRPHEPITEQEMLQLLMGAANTTAPGFSGIGWQLLKEACLGQDKVWEGMGGTLIAVFEACLALGHHPAIWKQAMVTVIPKPGKTGYICTKAHCPISMLTSHCCMMFNAHIAWALNAASCYSMSKGFSTTSTTTDWSLFCKTSDSHWKW